MKLATSVDGGDGATYSAFVANFPSAVAQVMEETARAVGVDINLLLGRGEETTGGRDKSSIVADTVLTTPVTLVAGVRYRVAAYTGGDRKSTRLNSSHT